MEERYFEDLKRIPLLARGQECVLAREFRSSVRSCEDILDQFPTSHRFVQEVLAQLQLGKPAGSFLLDADSTVDRLEFLETLRIRALDSQIRLADWHFRPDRVHAWCQQLIDLNDTLRAGMSNQPNQLTYQVTAGDEQLKSRIRKVEDTVGMPLDQFDMCVRKLRPLVTVAQQALNTLIESNLLLVAKVAKQFERRAPSHLMDLIQEGNLALVKAAAAYDPDEGNAKFSSFAWSWIWQAIMNWLADHSRTVCRPSNGHKLVRKIRQLEEQRPELTKEERARLLNVDVEEVEIVLAPDRMVSLDEPCGDEEGATLKETLVGQEGLIIDDSPAIREVLERMIAESRTPDIGR